MEKTRGIVCHAILLPRTIRSVRMRRRSATTGLIVEASHMLHKTVGVLFYPERGTDMHAVGNDAMRVAF